MSIIQHKGYVEGQVQYKVKPSALVISRDAFIYAREHS